MELLRSAFLVTTAVTMAVGSVASDAAAMPSPTVADPATQPMLLSDTSLWWVEGQSRWVTLSWTSRIDIDEFAVTVLATTPDVTVAYEDPSIGHAELSGGPQLSANEIDATTFFLDPGANTGETFDLELVATWKAADGVHRLHQTIRVQQRAPGDEPFLLLTDSARVPAGGDGARNWVSLGFLGLEAGIRDFSVSVEGVLPIYYPQRSFTSLHHDAVLLQDERDVARFWLDPSTIEPGEYDLEIVVTYTIGDGAPRRSRSPLHVTVD